MVGLSSGISDLANQHNAFVVDDTSGAFWDLDGSLKYIFYPFLLLRRRKTF